MLCPPCCVYRRQLDLLRAAAATLRDDGSVAPAMARGREGPPARAARLDTR
jgi:hypothetical protein